jgi:uncharacterized protein YkwD
MTDLRIRRQRAAALLVMLAPLACAADVAGAVNSVRARGCDARPGGTAPLRASARLDAAALQLAAGAPLGVALARAHYHAVSSFSVSVSEVPPDGDVAGVLARQFCRQSTNPAFREIGTARRGAQVWIALAEPFAPPAQRDAAAIARRVLQLANAARAQPRRCGLKAFAAAAPLTLNAALGRAALAYAQDLARHTYMEHTGRDGSSPAQRVTRSGYRWRATGENLASGVMTPEEVIAGWLESPDHCANLMDPAFSEMGVGFGVNPRDERGVYWALEFGRPL